MTELDFKDLYTEEYTLFIQSFFPKLIKIKKEYPHFLNSQIAYYESVIINQACSVIIDTIVNHSVNLSGIFGQEYEQKFMLDKITKKCWSIQPTIKRDIFDVFISDTLQKTEDD